MTNNTPTELPTHLGTEPKPMPTMSKPQPASPMLSADELAGKVPLVFTPIETLPSGCYPNEFFKK
jgi:hypothetical protein